MLWQPSLPDLYHRLTPDELAARITDRRQRLADSLVILGHHYQVDDVIRHADITGDSLKLSQQAAALASQRPALRHVVFCGVHFMAETADILTPDHVSVILPDLSAGCSMADMAQYDDTVDAWNTLHNTLAAQGWRGRTVPITYVNSSAAIKAFVGSHGGACCTSSNADLVFAWALAGGDHDHFGGPPSPHDDVKILFLPDQHLGRNTAHRSGIDVARHARLYDPRKASRGEPLGGMTDAQLADAKVILWAGHCSVHKLFRPEHIDQIRQADALAAEADPQHVRTRVIVHPECCKEVVDNADESGSTEAILKRLRSAPIGSRWAVGTEFNMVNRLAAELKPKGVHVRILSDCQCLCTTMYRIDQPHLLWILDGLCGIGTGTGKTADQLTPADLSTVTGPPRPRNIIRVTPEVRDLALRAVDRMLQLSHPLAAASIG